MYVFYVFYLVFIQLFIFINRSWDRKEVAFPVFEWVYCYEWRVSVDVCEVVEWRLREYDSIQYNNRIVKSNNDNDRSNSGELYQLLKFPSYFSQETQKGTLNTRHGSNRSGKHLFFVNVCFCSGCNRRTSARF